jgi:hypothetical protein
VIAVALALVLAAGAPRLADLRVSNGDTPFAGDGRLLTTVSPNGDGFRDAAIVRFRLTAPARVRLEAVRTETIRVGRPSSEVVWATTRQLGAGPQRLVWRPAPSTPPRTYVLRLTATDASAARARTEPAAPAGRASRRSSASRGSTPASRAGATRRATSPS